MRRLLALCVTALVTASSAVAADAAASPAAYRAKLNRLCRANTVTFDKLDATITRAEKANDPATLRAAFIAYFQLGLREAVVIQQEPVPSALRPRMSRAKPLLARAIALSRDTIAALRSGNAPRFTADVKKLGPLSTTLNKKLDAA